LRLRQIDDLALADHYHLQPKDRCWYVTEFTAGRKFNYSDGNRLICDLQLDVDADWARKKKEKAVARAAEILFQVLTPEQRLRPTWIPVPPSKAKGNPGHDSRVADVLRALSVLEKGMDIRELVVQLGDRAQAKKTDEKRDVEALYASYTVDETLSLPEPKLVVVFDDVVTTGRSFRAMERKIVERFPATKVVGVFLARRVLLGDQQLS
jgi:hypothetical protein